VRGVAPTTTAVGLLLGRALKGGGRQAAARERSAPSAAGAGEVLVFDPPRLEEV